MARTSRFCGTGFVLALAAAAGCGPARVEESSTELEEPLGAALVISEVAQSTSYGGTTADKVEVFCGAAGGCPSFKICDSAPGGSACSALQAALAAGQRSVVSRGTSITTSDEVWLADAGGVELAGTRAGPFDCSSGQSRQRLDCSLAGFGACGAPSLGASAGACDPEDFPEDFTFSVKFTTNQHGGPESGCARPMCQELVGLIDAATTSIDFAIYGVRAQQHVIDALVAAQTRGVVVRGAVDSEDSTCTTFAYPDTDDLIAALDPGSVVCDTGSGYSYIMHDKFFVFDGLKVWTGSTNISDTELGGEYNSDVAATIESFRLANIYTGEMDEMFAGLFHNRKSDNTLHVLDESNFTDGSTVVTSYFSPTDDARDNAVIPLIDAATSTLDIAMFYLTSAEIGAAILAADARGVAVRVVIDAGGAGNAYSQTPALCSAGIPVKTENWGGKSHSKWAVADSAIPSQAAVVFGSMNWTSAGNANNDENTLYVRNAAFAAEFQTEFERQWSDLAGVPDCTAVSAEGADSSVCGSSIDCTVSCSSGSCCDGSDNDYDGHSDLTDEGCACGDGIDNDGDGYTDSADWECNVVIDP
ncbi:MAG TPA: phospholipase D-like domain-containing protein [Polyangiaceae bacterium]